MSALNAGTSDKPELLIMVAVWDFIAAAFWLVGIMAAALFAYPFSPGYEASSFEFGDLFGMIAGTLFLTGCAAVALASGVGVLTNRRWGLAASILNAWLSLLLVPFGTVVGILALFYLRTPAVKEYFATLE